MKNLVALLRAMDPDEIVDYLGISTDDLVDALLCHDEILDIYIEDNYEEDCS